MLRALEGLGIVPAVHDLFEVGGHHFQAEPLNLPLVQRYPLIFPSNVLVRPDGGLVPIDLEVASRVDEGRRPPIADPGFLAPPPS